MNIFSITYSLVRWLISLLLLFIVLLFFVLNSPAPLLKLLQEPFAKQGIYYGHLKGGVLTGFTLSDVNYQDKVKAKSMALKIDFDLLKERVLYVDYLHLEEVQLDKDFLSQILDSNGSKKKTNKSNITLPFDNIKVKKLTLSLQDTSYQDYHIKHAEITLNNFETNMKRKHKGKMSVFLNSNVVQVELEAKIKDEKYELQGDIKGKELFLNSILRENNLTLLSNPKFTLNAKGDMERVNYSLETKVLALTYQAYEAQTKVLNVWGYYDLNSLDVQTKIQANIDANVAQLTMSTNTFVNLNNVNNSLTFDIEALLNPKQELLQEALIKENLKAQNIQVLALPKIDFLAKGNLNNLGFTTHVSNLKIRQDKIDLVLKSFDLRGASQVLKGDVEISFLSEFDSTITKGNIQGDTAFNLNMLKESLDFNAKVDLSVYDAYLNPLLQEHNISLRGDTPIKVIAKGNLEALNIRAELATYLIKENISSKIALNTEDIFVNLKEEKVRGGFTLKSEASNLALKMKSNFWGNYMKPKELKTDSHLEFTSFNAFGLNLTEFMPLTSKLNSGLNGGTLNIFSKKLNLKVKSTDYEHVIFEIKSDKIFPSKIMDLPKELKNKFVKLDLKGNMQLSKQYFSIKGFLEANKGFKLNILGHSKEEGLAVNIFSKHLKLTANGDLKTKKIKAVVEISSLKKVQKEYQSLYEFSSIEVDGAIKLNASLDGEQIKAKGSSEKIEFEAFSIENLDIDANYAKELITLNTLDFKTTGFTKEALNKHYYLNKQSFIHLGKKRDVYLDMHPNILVKATGNSNNLEALVQVESLALGHPDYGDFELSCDIDYKQKGKKKTITGAVFIDKIKLHYESKFLDPSQDNDVIILSKKDKKKKDKKDSFLEDTAIDIFIYTNNANYKTRDIDLEFMVDVKAKKDFGKPLGLFGKVKDINGRVEQAPKIFTVVDSNIVFKGGKEINPLLDIEVEYALPDVLITINIHGNAKRPKITFSSEPPLPKKDILSYLLLGVSTAALGDKKGSLGREAQLFIMNQASRDLAYEVGLDRLLIKDDGTGEGYSVQVGKKVNEKTMAIIENSKEGNSFILEYEVNENIQVEVGQHQKTVPSQSIDLYFRKRFK